MAKLKQEMCIMPYNELYSIERYDGLERHEVFFSSSRNKSIEDGLVVFLTPAQHRLTYGVHGKYGHELDMQLKQIAQQTWMDYYDKSIEDFIERYGRNYL